jgi:phage terminase large subunit-like protein
MPNPSSPVDPTRSRKPCDLCPRHGPHLCYPRADRVAQVFAQILTHTKGRWARLPFVLEDWQREGIMDQVFGWVEWSPTLNRWARVYRVAWIEIARKNGKSELLAGIALVLLVADDEEGAEVYGCAKDRDQARKVYDVAERMVELSPLLSRRLRIYKQTKRIVDERTGSYYEVVAADAAGNLGHNPHGIIFDEVLTQPSAELWDAFRSSMGTRDQALMIAATTAGNDPTGFCSAEHDYCERVLRDPRLDRRRFAYIRNTPMEADWRDEANWYYANPALGTFLSIEALRDEAREAELAPAKQNTFRQFRLNQWVQQTSRWLDLRAWDATAGLVVEEDLVGSDTWGGLDLATTTDLAALCWTFRTGTDEEEYAAIWRFWLPEARVSDLNNRTAGRMAVWIREGFVTVTPGEVIDYASIKHTIETDGSRFRIREVAYDRWGMAQLQTELGEEGLTVVPFGQNFASMSSPTREWERLILERKYRHGGNPVMRWMVDNVVVRQDPAGNIKIDKMRSHEKVDGPVAAVMALDRALRYEPPARSVYEDRGMVLL